MATMVSAQEQTMGSPPRTPAMETDPREIAIPVQDVVPPEEPQVGVSMPLSPVMGVERPTMAASLALATVLSEPTAAQTTAPTLGQAGQSGPGASFVMTPFVLAGLRGMPSPLVGGHPVGSAVPWGSLGRCLALVPFGGGP